ncbi:PEP-CTERM sorting domain-containing protein [Roseateles toxinivorans]|uniref:Putative secreted protein with PEP-CTERM sorting signal n=1 Tax=Roseateles toxinivorans TaxID=270368 RepID=A0A4R6QNS8_9BURK|nr:PEP-CTERM sorting domain-containing protein [Roseateles toxinivorans]TDP72490.1 putative secreted protein with PEP-CTERM sorting signal [Roseateles toxinivorans]
MLIKKLALVAVAAAATLPAQAALTAGDIAVVAYNTDTADNFAWVALVDIAANTTINFTDSSWQGSAFRVTEHLDAAGGGPLSWKSASALAAGSVVRFTGNGSVSWSTGTATGTVLNLANGGDQIFGFTGAIAAPNFLTGTQFAHANGIIASPTVSNSTNTTNVPTGLSLNAGTMVNLGNFDNGYYKGATTGTKAELLSKIGNVANWTRTDSGDYATSVWASSFTVTAVPEPESYALMLAGLGVMGFIARRRKQA